MSQGLTLSVPRLQEEGGRPGAMCSWSSTSSYLPFGGGFSHLENNSGNLHQILLSRYFREELKQRIWGEGLSWEGPIGPAQLQLPPFL